MTDNSIAPIPRLTPLTLEQLVAIAERLGRLKIEDDNRFASHKPPLYVAEIYFRRRAGSQIHARGEGPTIQDALTGAIAEAERLQT